MFILLRIEYISMSKYAAIDNEENIYGIGNTEQDALNDAKNWLESWNSVTVCQISDGLADWVNIHGGAARHVRAYFKSVYK